MNLSDNVKRYFVNALKGIGVGYLAQDTGEYIEFSEKEIIDFLNDPQTTTDMIYSNIKLAVFQQLNNDSIADKFTQKDTRFNRKTVEKAFGDKVFNRANLDRLLNQITDSTLKPNTSHLDLTTEIVIDTLFAGMHDQKLTQAEKQAGANVWGEVRLTGYKRWVANKIPTFEQFSGGKTPEEVSSEIMSRYGDTEQARAIWQATLRDYDAFRDKNTPSMEDYQSQRLDAFVLREVTEQCGDPIQARNLLATPVDEESMNYLRANGSLLTLSQEHCKQCGRDPIKGLLVSDVLAVTSFEGAGSQVVAYFQTRSREQENKIKANPKTIEVNKHNKIGNLLGKIGKKELKKQTKRTAVVKQDAAGGLPKGKAGPWRGYKKLYDRILGFLKEMYGNVMSIGFVQGIMEKKGTWINTEASGVEPEPQPEKEDVTKAWKIDEQVLPEGYIDRPQGENQSDVKRNPNAANEFYQKTTARLADDKKNLAKAIARINDPATKPADLPGLRLKAKYLEQCIQKAEDVLQNKMPKPGDKLFDHQQYFDELEKYILSEGSAEQAALNEATNHEQAAINADKGNLNVAGEFYNKAKARLLADQMRLLDLGAQSDHSVMSDEDRSKLEAKVAYLQNRIERTEAVLKTKMPEPGDKLFDNQGYFDSLENYILSEDTLEQKDEAEKPNSAETLANNYVKDFVKNTKHHSANEEMQEALLTFKDTAMKYSQKNDEQAVVARTMAVRLFHLDYQVEHGIVNNRDVDEMIHRFVAPDTQNKRPSYLDSMAEALGEYSESGKQKSALLQKYKVLPQNMQAFTSQDYCITAVDINAGIKAFVENDLQMHAARELREQHQTDQARDEIVAAEVSELERGR